MAEALDNLYELQNTISLSSLAMSEAQNKITNSKSVTLYFLEGEEAAKPVLNTL